MHKHSELCWIFVEIEQIPLSSFFVELRSIPQKMKGRWNFPSDNSGFGKREFNHVIDGTTYTAPVALFYPSEGKQHPSGGPKGYYYSSLGTWAEIDTPNWFYYYSKAWTPPCEIAYWDMPKSAYYYGDNKVHIGSPAHGSSYGKRPLYEMSNGVLTWVGLYQAYGIDLFARVITHENTHKQIWENYHQSIEDAKNDNVPDVLVDTDGNPILDANGHQQAMDPDADPDGDGLPTFYEKSLGLNPVNPDSTGFHDGWGYPPLKCDGDAVARYEENKVGTSPNRMADWADDGLNFGTTPGGLPKNRIKRYQRDGATPLP